MHYSPSPKDQFKIIVQITRFFKDFCDFETHFTPKFRHPLLAG